MHFLEALVNSKSEEVYENETLIAIIEFLYGKYKKQILRWRLPAYIM